MSEWDIKPATLPSKKYVKEFKLFINKMSKKVSTVSMVYNTGAINIFEKLLLF